MFAIRSVVFYYWHLSPLNYNCILQCHYKSIFLSFQFGIVLLIWESTEFEVTCLNISNTV